MAGRDDDWEGRVAATWFRFRSDELSGDELVDAIDALAAERPADDPAAAFERASARDSAGLESEAEPLHRAAPAPHLSRYNGAVEGNAAEIAER